MEMLLELIVTSLVFLMSIFNKIIKRIVKGKASILARSSFALILYY